MPRTVKEILKDNNFRFNKGYGQNFITDTNLLAAMVSDAEITNNDVVVEIGPGAGTLTKEIAKKAKKVFAFEIDKNLEPILKETLSEENNVEVVFKDIQKVKEEELLEIIGTKDYKVVANLPYYITTPIIMRFLESDIIPKSITIMVQKEVAERLVSKAKDEAYGAITLAIALEGDASLTRIVKKEMFMPIPKVDSAIVRIDVNDRYNDVDKKSVKKLIKAAFLMRRKTLVNNIESVYKIPKDKIQSILNEMGVNEKVRGEELDIDTYIELAKKL